MLPPEIGDHILGFLQDSKALEACATTLAQLAERHRYAHITVQNHD